MAFSISSAYLAAGAVPQTEKKCGVRCSLNCKQGILQGISQFWLSTDVGLFNSWGKFNRLQQNSLRDETGVIDKAAAVPLFDHSREHSILRTGVA